MAPRIGALLRAPLSPPKVSSTPFQDPENQQASIEFPTQIHHAYIEPIKAQFLPPRAAEPDKPSERPPFDWNKRLEDKRQYERQRYLKHDHPHHRMSHDIFDTLMLDTPLEMGLGHRSVPMEPALGTEAGTFRRENRESVVHSVAGSRNPALTEQKADTYAHIDPETETETQTFLDSSSSSSSTATTHQYPPTNEHDNSSQQRIPSRPLNSTCSPKPTKSTPESHPIPNQIIFHHPHSTRTARTTHSAHTINAHNAHNPTDTTTTHLPALALFLCIICFFICGWQACTSWRQLQLQRHRRRERRRGRGSGLRLGLGLGRYDSALSSRSRSPFTDQEMGSGRSDGGVMEMMDFMVPVTVSTATAISRALVLAAGSGVEEGRDGGEEKEEMAMVGV